MPDQIFCPLRKAWVAALPEEMVRQQLLHNMIHQLSYPLNQFAVEKNLRHIPHLQQCAHVLPRRRADALFFAQNLHPHYPLYPLILIECKAVKLTSKAIRQLIGYNYHVQAYYILLANAEEIRLGWYEHTIQDFYFIPSLLPYTQLLEHCQQHRPSVPLSYYPSVFN